MSASRQPAPRSSFPRLLAAARFVAAALLFPRPGSAQPAPALEPTEIIAQAERALAEGKAFRATRLLAPALSTAAPRSPALVLVAARAAAGWEGWGTVERLLAGQPWLDDIAGGEGRALLARARVERAEPALPDARRAVSTARGDLRAPRLLTLARAFDRANLLDSAAAAYRRAEELLPAVGDWLRLRAAGVLADSAQRAPLYRAISLPAALSRIRWTEALARDRTGDWRGAAREYAALGAPVSALRVRLRASKDSLERAVVRLELLALITPRLGADDTRGVVALLDDNFPNLTPEEELPVVRRIAVTDPARAVRGFARAVRARPALSDADKLAYGSALARLGRHDEAMGQLGAVRNRELQPQARYQRARSLLATGGRSDAIVALRELSLGFQGDSATGATAGYLAADLLVDEGNEPGARAAYLDVARRFPRTSHGARAAFQAALLAWVQGDRSAAGQEFAALAERAGETTEGIAAWYWSGRSLLAAGDSLGARGRWRTLLERFPASYYTVPAAERLGVAPVREPPPAMIAAPDTAVLAVLDRVALLEELGLRVEARFELDRLSRQAESTPGELFPTARAFFERGHVARAWRLVLRAPDATPQRLAFPLPGSEALEEARQAGVDPLLVAALIRQESGFDPSARSRADARGLMQVLPSVGAGLAPAAGIGEWDPALLYQAEINVHFGVAHLAQTLKRYRELPAAALAAYNAGERPTNRWMALPGAGADPDVFIERIQYVETRDYVRRVLRNIAVYRALYSIQP